MPSPRAQAPPCHEPRHGLVGTPQRRGHNQKRHHLDAICLHRALPAPGGLPPSSPPVNFECPSPLFFALVDYPCLSRPWCRRAFLQGSRCRTGGHRRPSRGQSPSHTRIAHSHGHVMHGDTGPPPLVAHDRSSALPHEPRPGVCSRVLVNMCTRPWTHTHVASSFELSARSTEHHLPMSLAHRARTHTSHCHRPTRPYLASTPRRRRTLSWP